MLLERVRQFWISGVHEGSVHGAALLELNTARVSGAEVPEPLRPACVEAINRFLRDTSVPGLAVCRRLEEYLALPLRLALGGAVSLQPLSATQVQQYLDAGGPRMAGLRELVARDAATRDLARSPLLLSVMTLAYQDAAAETRLAAAVDDEQRRAHIFDTYLDRMFARRGMDRAPYPKAEACACSDRSRGRCCVTGNACFSSRACSRAGWRRAWRS